MTRAAVLLVQCELIASIKQGEPYLSGSSRYLKRAALPNESGKANCGSV
jgi:hypothetical protein